MYNIKLATILITLLALSLAIYNRIANNIRLMPKVFSVLCTYNIQKHEIIKYRSDCVFLINIQLI